MYSQQDKLEKELEILTIASEYEKTGFTPTTVAKRLGVHHNTALTWCLQLALEGKLVGSQLPTRGWLFRARRRE